MIKKAILSAIFSIVCTFAIAQEQTATHIVQRGETLESIAEYYKISVEDINKANPNADGMMYVGMKLNIPASLVQVKESVSESTPINKEKDKVKYEATPSQFFDAPSTAISNKGNETTLGFQFARTKGIWLFPTELEKSTRGGHYRSSYNLSFVLEGEYIFNPNVFAGIGLGWMWQGSCNSDRKEDEIGYQQYKSQYGYVMLPLSIGYRTPITKNVNFDIYTGLTITYILSGYSQYRTNTTEEWNKTKLKDMENVKRFTPFWTVGARVNLWNFELGAEYWYLLSKTNEGGSKGAIAACFSLHI